MTNSGFEYTIEIKDRFAKILEEFQSALAAAKAEAGGLSKQLKALERASNEAKKALTGSGTETKAAVAATEDLSKAIGKATTAQRAKMTVDQRADDTLAKRIERQRELQIVEEKAAAQGINLSRKKSAVLKEELTLEEKIANVIAKRAAIRELNAGVRFQGFDAKGDSTNDRVLEKITRSAERRAELEGLRSRGFDARGDNTGDRVNEIIARQNELLATNAELKKRGFDAKGAPLKAEATLEERVTKILERQAKARELVEALRARGLDAKGAPLKAEATVQERISQIIERQALARQVNEGLRERGFDVRGNPLKAEATVQEEINRIIARQNRLRQINLGLAAQGRNSAGKIPLTPQEAAQNKVTGELRRLEIKKFYKEAEAATPRIAALRRELGETKSTGNRISFTFRRLFGILALFTVFRQVVTGFKDMIASSVQFNAQIETSTLGIASLISATGRVETATGKVASATEGWALAQKEARKQLALLRKDALTTPATFKELQDAFQTGIGPGLTAGLKIDEVRKFTSVISKAASALGLEQNQLPEEIRSILQGTISKRNTRIATSLGITNEDIKRAKELGTLYEFLETKFGAFNRASEDGAKTFNVLLSNAKDALGNLLGLSFQGFFESLKDLLKQINDNIVQLGGAKINPDLIKTFEVIGSVLELAVDEAKKIINTLTASGAAHTFEFIALLLRTAVSLVSDLVQGILLAARVVATILSPVVAVAKAIGSVLGPTINNILIWAVAIVASFRLIYASTVGIYAYLVRSTVQLAEMVGLSALLNRNLAAGAVIGPLTQTATIWATILGYVTRIGAFLASWGAIIGIVTAGLGVGYLLLDNFKKRLEEITGLTSDWGTVLKTVFVSAGNRMNALKYSLIDLFASAFDAIKQGVASLVIYVAEKLSKVLKAIPDGIPGVSAGARAATKELDALAGSLNDAREVAEAKSNANGSWLDRLKKNLKDADALTVAYFKSQASEDQGSNSFKELFDQIPTLISSQSRDFDALATGAEKLKDEINSANHELRISLATLRATGAVQQQLKVIAETRAEIDKQTKVFDADRKQAEQDLKKASQDRLEIERKLASMSEGERGKVKEMVGILKEYSDANSKLIDAQDNQKIAKDAFAKGKVSLLDVQRADVAVKEAQAVKDGVEARGQALRSSQANFDLSLGLLDVEQRENDARRRGNESLADRKRLTASLYALMESKIAVIGTAEFEAGKLRIEELKAQQAAARRLLGGAPDAAATNEVEAAKRHLAEVVRTNKAQQEGLEYVIKNAKTMPILIALQASLNQLKQEGAAAEALALAQTEQAEKDRAAVLREVNDSRRAANISAQQEIDDIRLQIAAEESLLNAKVNGRSIDEQIAESNNQMEALKARNRAEAIATKEKQRQLVEELKITSDIGVRAHLEGQLAALQQKTLQSIILQAVQMARLRAEQKALIQGERDRNRELAINTAGSRASFDAGRGTDREATALVEKFVQLQREEATLQTILNTQKASTAEVQAQQEAVRQVQVEYQRLLDIANDPVGEGLFEGAKQFLLDVPTAFETAANFTKTAFQGLADVAADSLTAAFDPRNTTTLRERLGELFLGLGNLLFKSIFENLIGTLLSNLIPSLASSGVTAATALTNAGLLWQQVAYQLQVAAANLAAAATGQTIGGIASFAGGIGSGGLGAGINSTAFGGFGPMTGYRGGLVRSYRRGGRIGSGSTEHHPEDNIPAFLRKNEYVLTPEKVSALGGPSFLDNLSSMSLARSGVRDPAKAGSAPQLSSRKQGAGSGSTQKLQVAPGPAFIVANEQALESLLAQGDGAMQRYLESRGYKPSWGS